MLRAGSIMLFGLHGSVPESLSIDVANAGLFASFALTVVRRARVRPPLAGADLALVGVTIWLLACRLPQFSTTLELRAMVGSGIVTAYTWLAAFEFWRSRDEPLVSRWPAIFMLFAHGALFLLRTPLGVDASSVAGKPVQHERLARSFSASRRCCSRSPSPSSWSRWRRSAPNYRHRNAASTDELTGIANRRGFLEQAVGVDAPRERRQVGRGAAVRSRPFQADQRPVRSRHRRPRAADLRRHREGSHRSDGSRRALGRRRVRRGALRHAERPRGARSPSASRSHFEKATADIDGRPARATVSTGMVFSTAGAIDLPSLLVQADEALYRAKEKGRNRLEVTAGEAAAVVSESERQAARAKLMRRQDAAA